MLPEIGSFAFFFSLENKSDEHLPFLNPKKFVEDPTIDSLNRK